MLLMKFLSVIGTSLIFAARNFSFNNGRPRSVMIKGFLSLQPNENIPVPSLVPVASMKPIILTGPRSVLTGIPL
jgi:hypothetical protein